ncbi:MAG TPA: carbonic anhydrase [Cytophagales bacterium]|nr:carbonic anhydrase [Cytophagales bacterium]HAA23662.1 carbonic anhydrase [Cytophagales bacterium]HAP59262.1 carbonic anhydrase [Cytophagales bacterium]
MSFSADTALQILKEGNRRYMIARPINPLPLRPDSQDFDAGQRPFAAVLTCADSRLSPEIIFDTDHGHLFVVRTAGNIASDFDLGSLEFSVLNRKNGGLGVNLIVVMGHEKCGAVEASQPGEINLPQYLNEIRMQVRENLNLRPGETSPRTLEEDTISNAQKVARRLLGSKPISEALERGTLKIVEAYYKFNGEVFFSPEIPTDPLEKLQKKWTTNVTIPPKTPIPDPNGGLHLLPPVRPQA